MEINRRCYAVALCALICSQSLPLVPATEAESKALVQTSEGKKETHRLFWCRRAGLSLILAVVVPLACAGHRRSVCTCCQLLFPPSCLARRKSA
jgi:hypothetical protein